MNYIYDIILNFTDDIYYDFFEWNKKDNLINVKKIPLIHINKNKLYDIINYKIRVDSLFLNKIDGKSIYLKKDKDKYNYSVIFSNGEKSVGVCFDKNGIIKYKSSLLLDEEEEANRIAFKEKEFSLKYIKYEKNKKELLRLDLEKKNNIIRELKRIYNNKEYDKLKYIYYEINNKIINDTIVIYNLLINDIDNNIHKYDLLFDEIKIK